MQICVIGTGYVGLVAGACLAEAGHLVTCVDNNAAKIAQLADGVVTIHEPGLPSLVSRNLARGRLSFTTDLARAANSARLYFIAVGTPSNADGSADITQVLEVARLIGRFVSTRIVVAVRSTVSVGTTERVEAVILEQFRRRSAKAAVDVAYNPEFLREGNAINDFMRPDRVLVGTDSAHALALLRRLYDPFLPARDAMLVMRVREAELAKQAANAMLATRVSFINEIAGICDKLGVDAESVRVGIGSDSRIGPQFIHPGCGYGGSCLPKDTRALIRTAYDFGYEPAVLSAVDLRNRRQKAILFEKIRRRFGPSLRGLRFAVWGLAFKPGTDDMREAPALVLLQALLEAGAAVKAHDPEAMANARRVLPPAWLESGRVRLTGPYDAVESADALVLVTEWKVFQNIEFERLKRSMRRRIIFDGRNQYDPMALHRAGFEYYGIGRAATATTAVVPDLKLAVSQG
jgi:UDPglucose 6-dehydrogenase